MTEMQHWFSYMQLTHRYAFALDVEGGTAVADMFTPDGVWDANDLGYGYLEGREALHGYFAGEEGRAEAMAHLFSNHEVLEATEDRMRARAYVQGIVVRAGKEVVRHDVVLYDDQLVKVDGEWKFERRTLRRVLDFRTNRKVPSAG